MKIRKAWLEARIACCRSHLIATDDPEYWEREEQSCWDKATELGYTLDDVSIAKETRVLTLIHKSLGGK